MAQTNLTDGLISVAQTSSVMRPGIVTNWDPTQVSVLVGGSEFSAAYLDTYSPPIVGDLVACIRQDSTWLVLGRFAGAGINLVNNPSFETDEITGGAPTGWTSSLLSGAALPGTVTVTVQPDAAAPQAGNVVQVTNTSGVAQDVITLSTPIGVAPGDTYFISAYAANSGFSTSSGLTTPPHDVQLVAAWFTTLTEAFPSATLTDDYTMVDSVVDIREAPPYTVLSGAVQVPNVSTIAAMRVGLRSQMAATTSATSGTIRWDYVTARRAG